LSTVGLDLLLRDLTRAELVEDALDVRVSSGSGRRADQHLLQLEVVVRELLAHLLTGEILDRAAILQELDERAGLADVLEVRRHHRVE